MPDPPYYATPSENGGDGFTVPFPFTPYPLQLAAMGELRHVLAKNEALAERRGMGVSEAPPSDSAVVAVLEAPTGTGKSQMLLNSVLSHLFQVDTITEQCAGNSESLTRPLHPASHSNTSVIRPAKRRRSTCNRRLDLPTDGPDPFLLDQDGGGEAGNFRPLGDGDGLGSRRPARLALFESSSDDSSAAPPNGDDESEPSDDEGEMRKPKVYFASRTHTQLAQMTEELRRTIFAQNPVRRAPSGVRRADQGTAATLTEPQACRRDRGGEPHVLRYTHVAGRQQLCINSHLQQLAGGNSERLNELCLEAMRYERSAEGRRTRKQRLASAARPSHSPKVCTVGGDTEDVAQFAALPDVEDLAQHPLTESLAAIPAVTRSRTKPVPTGCVYCARGALRLFRDYIAAAPRSLAEMREVGLRIGACPFLATRSAVRGADVVLIPYGYLVDSRMRDILLGGTATNDEPGTADGKLLSPVSGSDNEVEEDDEAFLRTSLVTARRLKRPNRAPAYNPAERPPPSVAGRGADGMDASNQPPNFAGDVVVIDEAHNLLDCCREVSRAEVDGAVLQHVQLVLQAYLTRYENQLLVKNKQRLREIIHFLSRLERFMIQRMARIGEHRAGDAETPVQLPRCEGMPRHEVLAFTPFVFDAEVDTVNVITFLNFLEETNLVPKLLGLLQQLVINATAAAADAAAPCPSAPRYDEAKTLEGQRRAVHFASTCIRRFVTFLEWYSRSSDTTRVLVSVPDPAGPVAAASLRLIQLEPGMHTFFPVVLQAETVILAGGTMFPTTLTCDPLALVPNPRAVLVDREGSSPHRKALLGKRPYSIRTGHIIPPSSLAVFAVAAGPSGRRLDLRYSARQRSDEALLADVSLAILNLARVVPAGMIVFFTSYEMENQVLSFMRQSGHYDDIQVVKRIFRESDTRAAPGTGDRRPAVPSKTTEMLLREYTACALSGANANAESSGAATAGMSRQGGALLSCVMGGKLSEGINFNDDLGRCVVVVGVPYPNSSDVELQLQLEHLATRQDKRGDGCLHTPGPAAARAEQHTQQKAVWDLYTALCMRTVNQSIGRCIRHLNDYAAVVLLDARYSERAEIRKGLSEWIHPSYVAAQSFGECFRGVRDFFRGRGR